MNAHRFPCEQNYSKTYEQRQDHQAAWQEFLGRWEWDWFCTFTFRGESVHPEKADKAFRHFVNIINRTLYGSRWFEHGDGIRWLRALEIQRRGVIHYHALLGDHKLHDLRRLTYMDKWDEIAGFARIEAIRSSVAVMRYVSKYVLKDGEIELGGPLRRECGPLLKNAVGFDSPESHAGIQGGREPDGMRGLPGLALKASPGACS